eukprot:1191521-Prorocentrum_minimum.AAC.2
MDVSQARYHVRTRTQCARPMNCRRARQVFTDKMHRAAPYIHREATVDPTSTSGSISGNPSVAT